MALQPATTMTYDDYLRLPDDGRRYEIIRGELFVNPAPFTRHQRISRKLVVALDRHFMEYAGGEVFFAPMDVVFTRSDVVQPDVLVILDNNPVLHEKNVQGAPDLVVEILSEGNRRYDEVAKRRLYDEHGVHEYWIVDPELELVKIYRRNAANAYERAAEVSAEKGGVITTPLLPKFELAVADIFSAPGEGLP